MEAQDIRDLVSTDLVYRRIQSFRQGGLDGDQQAFLRVFQLTRATFPTVAVFLGK
jgi:hypothetical protein